MIAALQILVDALSLGSLYALATLGVGLVFGVLRLANFAYGDFITVASYALIVPTAGATAEIVIGRWPWPLLVAAVVGVVVILSLASDYLIFRPLRTAKPAVMMVGSFALGYIIQNTIIVVYDGRPKAIGIWPGLGEAIVLGGLRVPRLEILTIVVTLVLLGALVLFLKRSPFGVQMRAASEDFRMARMLGVPANTVIGTSFVISGFLAAVVSLLFLAQVGVVSFNMGVPLMLFAFVATVIGGMGSLTGAVLGGYIVGVASVLLQALLPEELRTFRDAFVFGIIIVILIVRPQGLMMPRAVKRARVMTAGRYPFAESLARSASPIILCGAIALIVICTAVANRAALDRTVTEALIRIVYVVGLYIFVGNSGVISFGHTAFMAVGAYATAWQDCCSTTKSLFMPALPNFLLQATVPPPSLRSYRVWLRRFSPPSSA